MLLSSIMFSLLGVAAGLLAGSSPTLMMFNSIIILPMSFMCGTLFDVSELPTIIGDIVWALPLSHTTTIMREAANCLPLEYLSVAIIFVYIMAFYSICHYVIRKKLY